MPQWAQWLTLVAACLSAAFAGLAVLQTARQGRRSIKVTVALKPTGTPDKWWVSYKAVNTGAIPVSIEKVALTRGVEEKRDVSILENAGQRIRFPYPLEPQAALAAVSAAGTFDEPFMRDVDGIVVQLTDGRRFRQRYLGIREHALKRQTAWAEQVE